YSSVKEIWIGAAPKTYRIAEKKIPKIVFVQLTPLDQVRGFSENIGHVRHVKMADIGPHHSVKLDPTRIHVGAKCPCGDRIVRFAAKIEMAYKQIADVLGPRDPTPREII